jgi:dTDP-4-amino-4,6-dideoxygalactose transaminase
VISGNYRLGEFQGAILNAQLDRLDEQTATRDRNGQYLAAKLAQLPGIYPQKRSTECTRHSYHLFMLRMDRRKFGVSRDTLLQALQAEGIPCSAGYGYSLPNQPLFQKKAFGPYLPNSRKRLDYRKANVPNSDLICWQSIWFGQSMLLGTQADMDDIANAFDKIYQHRDALKASAR